MENNKKVNMDKLVNLKDVYILDIGDGELDLCLVEKKKRFTVGTTIWNEYNVFSFKNLIVYSTYGCKFDFSKNFKPFNVYYAIHEKTHMTVKQLHELQQKLPKSVDEEQKNTHIDDLFTY